MGLVLGSIFLAIITALGLLAAGGIPYRIWQLLNGTFNERLARTTPRGRLVVRAGIGLLLINAGIFVLILALFGLNIFPYPIPGPSYGDLGAFFLSTLISLILGPGYLVTELLLLPITWRAESTTDEPSGQGNGDITKI
jgi:hypothetical protein